MEEKIIKILQNPNEYKWQTSLSLSKKIKNSTPEEVEDILIKLVKENPNSQIRYSTLPSKKNLNVLWGHKNKVGERKLFDLFKEDKEALPDYLDNDNDQRNIFLSHSFKDTKEVFNLSRKLVGHGLNPWIAEVDIERGQHINNNVIDAIIELPFFGIYLSKNVLNSAWSAKEFEFAFNNKKKLFAFIPENEIEIIDLIEKDIPIDYMNIHYLLRKIFDSYEVTDRMNFLVVSNKEIPLYNRINSINNIINDLNL